MTMSISHECKLLLYADDSAFLFSVRDPEVISPKLSSELEYCSKWLVNNKLSLHLGKQNVFCLVREENPEKFMILRLNAIGTQ